MQQVTKTMSKKFRFKEGFASASVLILSLVFFQACAEKRPETFAQGQGIDIESKASIDGRGFSLTTESEMKSVNTTQAQNVKVNSKALKKEINEFGVVKYKTDAALLGDIPLVARPNTKYEVRYQLTDKYLKVLLVGQPEEIPYTQHPNAEKLADGRLALPLVGYPIEYYRVENQLNSDREKTQTLIQVPESDPARASHVRVLYRSREVFQFITKIDVYPSNLFDGTWYYAETVVDTSIDQTTGIGATKSVDTSLSQATKIRFIKTGNSLRGVNVTIAKNIKEDEINYSTVIELPVDWKEFRTRSAGSDKSMNEESVEETPWDKRPYMQVKFDQIKTLSTEAKKSLDEDEDFSGSSKLNVFENSKLVDIEIDDDYIGFTIFRMSQGVRVKYSFLRVKPNDYEARRYFKSDSKKFGFFKTVIPEVVTWKMHRQEDIEKNFQISRFNPKHDIVFRFAKGTPQRLKLIGRKAVQAWDEAFQKAGAKSRVVLDEGTDAGAQSDVSLGDLRYNVINLIESASGSNLFGFGPSIADSDTGEIISATANVHVTSIKEQVVDAIRAYIAHELGLLKGKNILAPIVTADAPEGVFFDAQDYGSEFFMSLGEGKPALPLSDAQVQEDGSVKKVAQRFFKLDADSKIVPQSFEKSKNSASISAKLAERGFGGCKDKSISLKSIDRTISERCPSLVVYIDDLKKSKRLYNSNEIAELDSCAEEVMQDKILATLVHEMGHNLGLRHNFKGSTDKENFHPKDVTHTAEIVNSSSVMEYTSFSESRLLIPGAYDVAAIRFGYGGAVEKAGGASSPLDFTKSIDDQKATLGELKKFAYCTDEDSMQGIDPMCRLHDAGVTPEEVVDFVIDEFRNTIAHYAFRYDRIRSSSAAGLDYASLRSMIVLKRFYDEWRFVLRDYVDSKNEYLESYSQEQYGATLKAMSTDANFSGQMMKWRPAAVKAFQFLVSMAQLPNRYCVTESVSGADKKTSLIELSQVRETVYKATRISVKHCADEAAKSSLEVDGAKLIDEVGFFIDNTRYSMNIEDMLEPFDAVGVAGIRLNAASALAARTYMSAKHAFTGFVPNFYDEPDMRAMLLGVHQNRLFKGVSLNPKAMAETLGDAAVRNYKVSAVPRFSKEAEMLKVMNVMLKGAGRVPGHTSATAGWMTLFRAGIANNEEILKRDGAVAAVQTGNGFIECFSKRSALCVQVVNKMKELQELLSSPGEEKDLNELLSELTKQGVNDADIDTVTVAQFMAAYQGLIAKVQKVPAFARSEKLMQLATAFDAITQKLMQLAEAGGARSEEDVDAFLNSISAKTLKELGAQYPLAVSQVEPYAAELKKVFLAKSKVYNESIRYEDEYLAQRELLTDLLLISQ